MQGEELSRGPHVFAGYLGNPEATELALSDDGWFASGICTQGARGRIRINGRVRRSSSAAENIQRGGDGRDGAGCPGIGDHATVGVPDARLGERICLFAVPADTAR